MTSEQKGTMVSAMSSVGSEIPPVQMSETVVAWHQTKSRTCDHYCAVDQCSFRFGLRFDSAVEPLQSKATTMTTRICANGSGIDRVAPSIAAVALLDVMVMHH